MAALGGHGARTVYVCDDAALAQSLPQPMVDALAGVLAAQPHDSCCSARACSHRTSPPPRGAARRGLIVDAIELHAEGGRVVTRRPGSATPCSRHCALVGDRGVIVARANTYAPAGDAGGAAPRWSGAGHAGLVERRARRRP